MALGCIEHRRLGGSCLGRRRACGCPMSLVISCRRASSESSIFWPWMSGHSVLSKLQIWELERKYKACNDSAYWSGGMKVSIKAYLDD